MINLKAKYILAGFKTIYSIMKNKIFGSRQPLLAYMLLTNRCNLNCVYCFSNAHKTQNMDMPLNTVFKVVDELKKSGTVMITLTGGEPCLRQDISEIINYIVKQAILVELVTNGLNFEKHLESIKKVDFLAISVDGDEEAHDKNRGNGSYKVAIKALETALANNIHTRIHACFSKYNANSLPQLMEICKKYNVRVNIAVPSIHTTEEALGFSDEEIRKYYREMLDYKRRGYPISNAESTLRFISNWPLNFGYVSEIIDKSSKCLPCKRKDFSIYIDADGMAYPCCSVWGKHKFNAFELGVDRAFNSFFEVPCQTCICEAEFHLLFKGSPSSIMNVAAFGIMDRLRRKSK